MPQLGDKIPVRCQTANYTNSDFAQAVVKDANENPISGSPFSLTPNSTGYYINTTAIMPNSSWVSIDIKFYQDSGFTTLSDENGGTDYQVFLDAGGGGGSTLPSAFNIIGVVEPDGCSESPIQDTIVQGSDRTLAVRLVQDSDGKPFDLSAATEIAFRFRNADGTALVLTTAGGSPPVQIVSSQAGELLCVLTASQTALLASQIPSPFSVVVTASNGTTVVNLSTQVAVVEQDV